MNNNGNFKWSARTRTCARCYFINNCLIYIRCILKCLINYWMLIYFIGLTCNIIVIRKNSPTIEASSRYNISISICWNNREGRSATNFCLLIQYKWLRCNTNVYKKVIPHTTTSCPRSWKHLIRDGLHLIGCVG